ncbi:hypothetical protein [Flavobacterium sp. 103]|nr:hypothetical protein [Flavobacterium sp. 103]
MLVNKFSAAIKIISQNSNNRNESIDKNVLRAVNFLLGKERFIGRDKP